MKKSIQVNVLGQQYTLKTEAQPEQVHEVVTFVNKRIEEVVGANRAVDTLNTAVLALLNVAGSYLRLQQSASAREQDLYRLVERLEDVLAEDAHTDLRRDD